MATTITKIVRYRVKKKKLSKQKASITKLVSDIKRNESGTILYEIFQEKDDPTTFVHVMTFKNRKAERIHAKSEHLQKWMKTLQPICKDKPELTDLKLVKSIQDSKNESSSATDNISQSQQ